MDANADLGGWDWRGGGMESESAGTSFGRGVGRDGEGVGGGASRRELDLLRPRVARVRGGRTFVEEALCLLGGGAGGQREADMARKQRRRGSRARGWLA